MTSRSNRLISKFILNPFFWFSAIWVVVLIIHSIGICRTYPPLSTSMSIFFAVVIISSFLFGIIYHFAFLKKVDVLFIKKSEPSWAFIILSYVIFLAEFLYCKQIPLIAIFRGQAEAYKEFGIPSITFLNTTFVFFISIITSVKLIYGNKANRMQNLGVFALCLLRFIITYSRGSIIFCGVILLLVFVSKHRISFWVILFLIITLLVGLRVFNALGNIRMGSPWNDSSIILKLARVQDRFYVIKDYIWTFVYIDSPIGNLLYNEANFAIEYSVDGLISQLIPDVLSKRIFPDYGNQLHLAIPGLNVSSMFAGTFKYYGYLGMSLAYIELVATIFIVTLICKGNKKYLLSSMVSFSFIMIMSFFDNMLIYSGYSFYLIYIILGRLIEGNDEVYQKLERRKLLLQYYFLRG